MEQIASTRLAVIAVIVQNPDSVSGLNELLHEYSNVIIGRMGIPCRNRSVNLMSIALDAVPDKINALSGKIGRLPGVKAKTLYS